MMLLVHHDVVLYCVVSWCLHRVMSCDGRAAGSREKRGRELVVCLCLLWLQEEEESWHDHNTTQIAGGQQAHNNEN
jgi:hypothetical protein